MEAIDHFFNNIENKLSNVAAYPILGTFAGLAKVTLGAAQVLTALFWGVISFIPATIRNNWSSTHYAWTYIKHGLANIGMGFVEAIPLVGTGLYFIRKIKQDRATNHKVCVVTGQENKFMPYTSLIEHHWRIEGKDAPSVRKIQDRFDDIVKQHSVKGKFLTSLEKISIIQSCITLDKAEAKGEIITFQ